MRTEISCWPKGEKLAWFWFSVRIQIVKAWPIDPLSLRTVQLEVSEKLPQGLPNNMTVTILLIAPHLPPYFLLPQIFLRLRVSLGKALVSHYEKSRSCEVAFAIPFINWLLLAEGKYLVIWCEKMYHGLICLSLLKISFGQWRGSHILNTLT